MWASHWGAGEADAAVGLLYESRAGELVIRWGLVFLRGHRKYGIRPDARFSRVYLPMDSRCRAVTLISKRENMRFNLVVLAFVDGETRYRGRDRIDNRGAG